MYCPLACFFAKLMYFETNTGFKTTANNAMAIKNANIPVKIFCNPDIITIDCMPFKGQLQAM